MLQQSRGQACSSFFYFFFKQVFESLVGKWHFTQEQELIISSAVCSFLPSVLTPLSECLKKLSIGRGPHTLCLLSRMLLRTECTGLFVLINMLLSLQSYEVRSVLGKEVGLLCCYVHSASSQPNCVGLEEIALLEAERNWTGLNCSQLLQYLWTLWCGYLLTIATDNV